MNEKQKSEQAIEQAEQAQESDKIRHSEDHVMFCGCSKHKSKQPNIPKLDETTKPSEIIENKKQ